MSQLPIPLPLNESRWRYVTASGGGVTVAFLAGSGGSITLLSPEGENVSFRYGGVGGGIGLGMRLPRFGKVNLNVKGKSVGGAGALEALPSTGTVLVADGLVGRDLSRGDFTGPCMYVELGAGVIAGGSGTAILFGLDPKLLAAVALASASPLTAALGASMSRQLLQSSRGALLMAGVNVGAQLGGGAAAYLGRCSDAGGRSGRIALLPAQACGGQGSVEFHGQRVGGGNRYRRGERSSEIPNRRGSVLSKQAHPLVRGIVLVSRLIMPGGPLSQESDVRIFCSAKERLDFYRREIHYETGQLSSRTNAYLTAQSFLVIAYASSMANLNPAWGELFTLVVPALLALLGIVNSLHAWPGIQASSEIICHWQFKQSCLLHSDPEIGLAYDDSPLFSEREVNRGSFEKTLLFSRRVPFLFAGFWCALGVFSLWLQLAG